MLSLLGAEIKQPNKSPMPDDVASTEKIVSPSSSGHNYRLAFFKTYECMAWKNHVGGYNFNEFDVKRAIEGYGWAHADVRALATIAQAPRCPRDGKIVALGTERSAWNGDCGWTIFPSLEWKGKKWIFDSRDSEFLSGSRWGEKNLYFLVYH